MTALLITNILSQVFLIFIGFSLLQLINIKNRISLLYDLPYAWGVGVVFLYIVAFPLIRFELSPNNWFLYILLIGLVVISMAGYLYSKANASITIKINWQLKWYDWLLIFVIVIKLLLLIYGNLVNPVVDSDATNNSRLVGLAKYIFMQHPLSDTNAYSATTLSELSLPILNAWSNIFQDRWHDSVATIHYVFVFIWTLMCAGIIGIKQQIKPTFSLLAIFIISSIPLLSMHVLRPGFADIMIMHFFMISIVVLFSIINKKSISNKNYFLLIVTILGMVLTKLEGMIWSAWVIIVVLSLYLNYQKQISWKTILTYQAILLVVGFGLYLVTADWVLRTISLPLRVSWLFDLQYNPRSFDRFFSYMYSDGGQGLIWWIFSITSVLILIKSKINIDKIIVLYALILMLGLFHFSNFTYNITFTLLGTNVGRFLLQISPIVLIGYYLVIKNLKTK